ARLLQEKGGHGFVDATLDGTGRIPYENTEGAQRVQDAEAARDSLESSRSHGADQSGIGKTGAEAGEVEAGRTGAADMNGLQPGQVNCATTRLESPCQSPAAVAQLARDHQDLPHSARLSLHGQLPPQSSRAKSRAPARNVSPVSMAVTITSAGLKSKGSMA